MTRVWTAPYGGYRDPGLSTEDRRRLSVLEVVVARIAECARGDPAEASRLSNAVLTLLLGPSGRALAPYTTAVVARLLAHVTAAGGAR